MKLPRRSLLALLSLPFLSAVAHAQGSPELSSTQMIGKKLRVIKPGQALTMDYNEDRLNVVVDDKGLITRISIG